MRKFAGTIEVDDRAYQALLDERRAMLAALKAAALCKELPNDVLLQVMKAIYLADTAD